MHNEPRVRASSEPCFGRPAPLVQGNGGMAQKPTTTKNLDSDVAKELEHALDFDLTGGDGDLDIAASMEDLEAQISQAADELARESGQDKAGRRLRRQPPAAARRAAECRRSRQKRPPRPANEWRPVAAPTPRRCSRPACRRPMTTARRISGRSGKRSTGAPPTASTGWCCCCRSPG